jgi:isopentenyl-diphosphate delta-isomerase
MSGGRQLSEQVVLVDDAGQPVGTADKIEVHGADTPRHLAFSCYGFSPDGRLLVTQRALDKRTFPGFWTNTCCGHPAPGEEFTAAVARRMDHELGLVPKDLRLVLPDFSYTAEYAGIVENELCPVFVCQLTSEPRPRADEVAAYQWWPWDRFLTEAADPHSAISPWARLQAPLLRDLAPAPAG